MKDILLLEYKFDTIDGNRDVYIGTRDMKINDLEN